jgi:hypothetical protein
MMACRVKENFFMRVPLCTAALVLSILGAGLAGCGSGSSGGATTVQDFVGAYTGFFAGTVNGATESGTLAGKIDADRKFTGVSHSNASNSDATVTGSLTTAGLFTATFVYPAATITATGTVARSGNRHLLGTLTESNGTTTIGTISIDLTSH